MSQGQAKSITLIEEVGSGLNPEITAVKKFYEVDTRSQRNFWYLPQALLANTSGSSFLRLVASFLISSSMASLRVLYLAWQQVSWWQYYKTFLQLVTDFGEQYRGLSLKNITDT
jgi:hypothetical protein